MGRSPQLVEELVGEWRWPNELQDIREFVQPRQVMVRDLARTLVHSSEDISILNMWTWVVDNIQYPKDNRGTPSDQHNLRAFPVNGRYLVEKMSGSDFWDLPQEVLSMGVSDCDGSSFLLASLLRNVLPEGRVFAVLGDLILNGSRGGHAWVEVKRGDGQWYLLDCTVADVPEQPWKPASSVGDMYQPAVMFNDARTLLYDENWLPVIIDESKIARMRKLWQSMENAPR